MLNLWIKQAVGAFFFNGNQMGYVGEIGVDVVFLFLYGYFLWIWLIPKTQYSTNFLVYHEALETKFLRLQELLEATKREGKIGD